MYVQLVHIKSCVRAYVFFVPGSFEPCLHRFGLAGFARFGKDVPGNALTGYDLDTKVGRAEGQGGEIDGVD